MTSALQVAQSIGYVEFMRKLSKLSFLPSEISRLDAHEMSRKYIIILLLTTTIVLAFLSIFPWKIQVAQVAQDSHLAER